MDGEKERSAKKKQSGYFYCMGLPHTHGPYHKGNGTTQETADYFITMRKWRASFKVYYIIGLFFFFANCKCVEHLLIQTQARETKFAF